MRISSYISLFAASLVALVPAHASAQTQTDEMARQESVSVRDRERTEYDAPGRRVGAFNLSASLDLSIASTDNLFAAPSATEVDDIIYTVAPQVGLSSNWSRHALTIDAGAAFRSHEDFSNEDADEHYIRGTGRIDVGNSTEIRGSTRFAHQVTPRTDPDSPLVGAPVEYDRIDASVGIAHRFARFRVSADAGRSEYDYDGAQAFRDNEETFIRGRIEAEVTPRVGILVQAEADERDYDNSPQFDSEGKTYLVGATLHTDLMRGEVSVGHFDREYAGVAGSFDGLAVAGSVEWYITRLTTLTFDGRRDADDQISATAGEPYITSEYGVRVDHELLRNVILTAGARWGDREYETIDRDDEYSEYIVGADYLLNPHAVARLRYEHDQVESSGALAYRDYEVNTVTLGLSLRL